MKRALLVIDVQNDYFTEPLLITHPSGSFENILRAMDGAAARGVPVVVIRHCSPASAGRFVEGTEGGQVHAEVAKRPHDVLIDKRLPGSFTGTMLAAWLREHGVDTVVISGYMTQMCCDTTARQAYHLGFGVEFLSDATGTLALSNAGGSVTAEELHRAILVTQAFRFSSVMTTDVWLEAIGGK
jgi:nicotinamidase-related amidase